MASHPDTVAAKQRLPDMTAIPVMRREGYYIVVLVVRTVSHLRAQAYRPQPGARGSGDLGTGSCRSPTGRGLRRGTGAGNHGCRPGARRSAARRARARRRCRVVRRRRRARRRRPGAGRRSGACGRPGPSPRRPRRRQRPERRHGLGPLDKGADHSLTRERSRSEHPRVQDRRVGPVRADQVSALVWV